MTQHLTKERKYNKIDNMSRLKGGLATKGTSTFTKEYQGLTHTSRMTKSALEASDNGRCWWIRDFILGDAKAGNNTHAIIYQGNGQELYPSKAYR
jgi:hypothetical protein